MKKWISFLIATQLLAISAFAKGKIQDADVKSLSDIEAAVLTTTGNLTISNACISSPASTSGLATGIYIYDSTNPTYIPSSTTVLGLPGICSTGQIEMSANATHAATGDTLTFGGQSSQLINDTKIWLTSVTPNQQLSSAITAGAIGGTSGSKNYLTTYTASTSSGSPNSGNGNFEQGSISGWSLGTVGTLTNGLPTGSPTFGSGASGNLSISTVTGGSQIAGNYSLSYVSSAATTQGNMLSSNAFYIDSEDQAKVMTVKFYYSVNSGSANDNFSGTLSNSFAWAAYDVTNSVWLSSAGNFCMTQNSGQGYCTGTFQTNTNTAQMRFVMYNANASSGATTLYFDDFFVGPQTAPFGPAMSDWVSYTPTFTGFGTATSISFYSRRTGDSLEISGSFISGTSTGVAAQISLGYNGGNGNVTIDSTKLSTSGFVGNAAVNNSSTTLFSWGVLAFGSNNFVNLGVQTSTANKLVSALGTAIATTGQSIAFYAKVPIAGWSSNTSMSNDTDTRVVAMQATGSTTASVNGTVALVNGTVGFDTHGAYNSSTGVYTVPVSGYYEVSGTWGISGGQTLSTTGFLQLFVFQNGSTTNPYGIVWGNNVSGAQPQVTLTSKLSCKAGDTLQLELTSNAALASSGSASVFTVKRLSGPAVIAATESVNAKVTTSNTSLTNTATTDVVFSTKVWDTHSGYNSSTGKYTIPVSGKYEISGTLLTNAYGTVSATQDLVLIANQSGSISTTSNVNIYRAQNTIADQANVTGSTIFNCLAGDQIWFSALNNLGTVSLSNTAADNFMTIKRIGN